MAAQYGQQPARVIEVAQVRAQEIEALSQQERQQSIGNRETGDSLRACRSKRFCDEKSITYSRLNVCKLLILRSRKSISDRLSGCPVSPIHGSLPAQRIL